MYKSTNKFSDENYKATNMLDFLNFTALSMKLGEKYSVQFCIQPVEDLDAIRYFRVSQNSKALAIYKEDVRYTSQAEYDGEKNFGVHSVITNLRNISMLHGRQLQSNDQGIISVVLDSDSEVSLLDLF